MKQKNKKGGFLSMLLGNLGPSLLGHLLSGKWILRAGYGNKKGKVLVTDIYRKQWDF